MRIDCTPVQRERVVNADRTKERAGRKVCRTGGYSHDVTEERPRAKVQIAFALGGAGVAQSLVLRLQLLRAF